MNIHKIWRNDLEKLPISDPLWSIYIDFCDDNELRERANGLRKIREGKREPNVAHISSWWRIEFGFDKNTETYDWNYIVHPHVTSNGYLISFEEYDKLYKQYDDTIIIDIKFSGIPDIEVTEVVEFLYRWDAIITLADLG
jgi:hypothetical protein